MAITLNTLIDTGIDLPDLLSRVAASHVAPTYNSDNTVVFQIDADHSLVLSGTLDTQAKTGTIRDVTITDHGTDVAQVAHLSIDLHTVAPFLDGGPAPLFSLLNVNLTFNGGAGGDLAILFGSGDRHTFFGLGGDDTLIGGSAKDVFNGGDGFDFASYQLSDLGVVASLTDPSGNTNDAQNDTYTKIEGLIGSAHADNLIGDLNANTLMGGGGSDTLNGSGGGDRLDGGTGIDYASYEHTLSLNSDFHTGVRASLQTPSHNTSDAKGDAYVHIEGLIGSGFNDTLIGNNAANRILGGQGDDIVTGGNGKDLLWGDTTEFSTDGSDTFLFTGATHGADTIEDYDVFDTIGLSRSGFHLGAHYAITRTTFVSNDHPHATQHKATFLYDRDGHTLSFDSDGSGFHKAVVIAHVDFNSQSYLDINDIKLLA